LPDGKILPGFTFNPWWICTEISEACRNCYAREWAKRFGLKWGLGVPRKPASERTWAEPLKWHKQALKSGIRRKVFCASMADVFDNEAPEGARDRLWTLIEATPALSWLLLTKRIGNVLKMVPTHWQERFPPHVWVGATVVTQQEVDRDVPKLLEVPASIRFLSVEPMIEELDLSRWLWGIDEICENCPADIDCECGWKTRKENGLPALDWVICGFESGPRARPCDENWIRDLRYQCATANVALFYKQKVIDGVKIPTPELDGKRWMEMPQ
jgi:protein gp37